MIKAIRAKLTMQRKYVLWRETVVMPSQKIGGPGRGKKGAVMPRPVLPAADPGQDTADRWPPSPQIR
jgi:hypothetical protein